jgi:hypothetical protein
MVEKKIEASEEPKIKFPSGEVVGAILAPTLDELKKKVDVISKFKEDISTYFDGDCSPLELGVRMAMAVIRSSDRDTAERDFMFDLGRKIIKRLSLRKDERDEALTIFEIEFPAEYVVHFDERQRKIGE